MRARAETSMMWRIQFRVFPTRQTAGAWQCSIATIRMEPGLCFFRICQGATQAPWRDGPWTSLRCRSQSTLRWRFLARVFLGLVSCVPIADQGKQHPDRDTILSKKISQQIISSPNKASCQSAHIPRTRDSPKSFFSVRLVRSPMYEFVKSYAVIDVLPFFISRVATNNPV